MFNLQHNRTPEQMAVLAKIYSMSMPNCKLYGKSKADVIEAVESLAFFTQNLPFEAMCTAFLAHVERNSELPTAADLNNTVNPPKPQISMAEYIQACDYQKRNSYPFGRYRDLIQEYEAERDAERDGWQKRQDEELAAIKQHGPAMLEKMDDFGDE